MILADGAAPPWLPDFIVDMTIGDIVGIVLAAVAIVTIFRKIAPFFRAIRNFLDDWNGVPERPGRDRQPGVMERLEKVEVGVETANVGVAAINKQIHPNGGSSMADKVNQIKEVIIPTQRNENERSS